MLRIEREINEDDLKVVYAAIKDRNRKHNPNLTRRFWISLCTLSAVLVLLLINIGVGDWLPKNWVGMLFLICLFMPIIWLTVRRSMQAYERRILSQPYFRSALGKSVWIVDEYGVASESRFGTARLNWKAFTDIQLTDDYLLLTFMSGGISPIRRHADDDAILLAIYELVRGKVNTEGNVL